MTTDGDLVPDAWQAPEWVTPAVQDDARARLAACSDLFAPAAPDAKREWLIALGTLTKTADGQNVAVTVSAYLAMLEAEQFPAGVFGPKSGLRAAKRFKTWFPGYGELSAFLHAELVALEQYRHRLQAIVRAPTTRPNADLPDEVPLEQRRKVADFFSQLSRGIAAAREGDDTILAGLAEQYGGEIRVKEGE